MSDTPKRVIIVGGGFGGLRAARELRHAPVEITLIDRCNHHLFQPLLYQVATAGLTAEEIAVPIRSVLRRQPNARVLLGEVERADLPARRIHLADGASMEYDYLVVAAGAQTNFYGHDDWQSHTVGLKELEDAFEVRRRVLLAFEAAEREEDIEAKRRLLTFCVIGGGPTGVEMAGALSELSRSILKRDFRSIDGSMIRVVLVEMGPRVLSGFDPSLSAHAQRDLKTLNVEVRVSSQVTNITGEGVQLNDEFIHASMVCWAAGVQPRPLAQRLGVATDKRGFVEVTEDCSVPSFPETFVIGDMAVFYPAGATHPLPGVAPVAMQQAVSVATNIRRSINREARRPFKYFDKGSMATIGTSRAVLQQGRIKMTGLVAWLAWLAVHVYYIIGFRNRALVMFEWAWAYLTRRRGARVITRMIAEHTSPGAGPAEKPKETAKRASAPLPSGWQAAEPAGAPYH